MGATGPKELLESVCVNYYASASKSCQSKHDVVVRMIQPYLDDLQDRFGLHRIDLSDLDDTGGSFSTNEDDITKWWWKTTRLLVQLQKNNGNGHGTDTMERYMGSLKNQLVK